MIVFGPIPSRRLGRSLGINNIPPKVCSYSCIYCQAGITDELSITRKSYYSSYKIFNEVYKRIQLVQKAKEQIDYLSFVPNGEPTLDNNLGKTIEILKPLGIKIALFTNSSLLWNENVRKDLMNLDWISLKFDTGDESLWHKINRPYGKLELNNIFDGIKKFASSYKGELVTETMLVNELNDGADSLEKTALLINELNPSKVFLLSPTRPPAEINVKVPPGETLNNAYLIFSKHIKNVELLASSEGTNFSYFSRAEKELLSILAVHPMQINAVKEFLSKANLAWNIVENLIERKIVKEIEYSGNNYLIKTNERG